LHVPQTSHCARRAARGEPCVRQETAVNIGFACSLLRTDMALYRVTAEPPAVLKLEDAGHFAEVRRAPGVRRAAPQTCSLRGWLL